MQRLLDQIQAPAIVSNAHGDLVGLNELGRALSAPVFDSPEQPANSAHASPTRRMNRITSAATRYAFAILGSIRAGHGTRVLSRGPWLGSRPAWKLLGMPHPTRSGLGEVAITTMLLSIYLSARGTNRALGVVQAAMSGLERSRS